MRYVPGLMLGQCSPLPVPPLATSVPNDCTRGPCGGGLKVAPVVSFAIGHVVPCGACVGLGAVFPAPAPPPTTPTILSDVGTGAGRLLARLIVRSALLPEGTVT